MERDLERRHHIFPLDSPTGWGSRAFRGFIELRTVVDDLVSRDRRRDSQRFLSEEWSIASERNNHSLPKYSKLCSGVSSASARYQYLSNSLSSFPSLSGGGFGGWFVVYEELKSDLNLLDKNYVVGGVNLRLFKSINEVTWQILISHSKSA